MKPYRVVATIKNNRLWSAITQAWPEVRNQADAARRLEIDGSRLGLLLNMKLWPGCAYCARGYDGAHSCRNGWRPLAHKVAEAVAETPEYLFDPVLYGRPARRIEIEMGLPALAQAGAIALPPAPDEILEAEALQAAIAGAMSTLTPREAAVLDLRFGLSDGRERDLEEIGETFAVGRERIRQIEVKALRKLRHPTRRKRIDGALGRIA